MTSVHPDPAVAFDALRVAVLLGSAAALAWSMGRVPARMRSILWVVALAGALVMPLGSRVLSPIEVEIPGWEAAAATTTKLGSSPVPDPETGGAVGRDRELPWTSVPAATLSTAPRSVFKVTWWGVAIWVWTTGTALLLLRLAVGSGRIASVVGRSRPVVDPEWTAALRRASRRVRCRRQVRLRVTDELDVPATTGVLRPTILLPRAAAWWLPDRREVVLMHELVHVRRLDWAARLLARLVTAIHWFDPLAWWSAARLDRDQERACDEEVLRAGVRASDYAAHLLEIARAARPRPLLAVPALELARRTDVEDRIMNVLETRGWRRSMMAVGIPAVLVLGSLVPAVAAIRPAPETPAVAELPEGPASAPAPDVRPEAAAVAAPEEPPATPRQNGPQIARPAPPASPELSELVREMERLEERIEVPAREVEEAVRVRIESKLQEIERIHVELDEKRLAELEARIRSEMEGIEELEIDLEPIQAEIAQVSEVIAEIELDESLDVVALRAQIEPHVARLNDLHAQLAPVHERMADLHVSLEPVHAEIEEIYEEMELDHERMEELQAELEPLHAEIERLHESIEPIREELERTGERLGAAVTREVESAIRDRMGPTVDEAAPWNEAAQRIVDASHIRLRDGVLRVDAPTGEAREILRDLLGPHRRVDEKAFDAALEATVDMLDPLARSVSIE